VPPRRVSVMRSRPVAAPAALQMEFANTTGSAHAAAHPAAEQLSLLDHTLAQDAVTLLDTIAPNRDFTPVVDAAPMVGGVIFLLVGVLTIVLVVRYACCNRGRSSSEDDEATKEEEELHKPPPPAAVTALLTHESSSEVRTRVLCVGFLCVQYSAYALLRRYATGILHQTYSFSSVLGAGEAIKFVISLCMIARRADASESPAGPLHTRTSWLLMRSGKMAVPAVLYLAMNMLGFVSLQRVDAGTFAIVQQSKIFFTALFGRLFLGRVLSTPKWCALSTLVCGVVTLSLYANPDCAACFSEHAPHSSHAPKLLEGAYVVGVVAVALDSALSGFATIYFEKVLKTTILTVWDRNLQLSFWSMTIYLPWSFIEHADNPLAGWSWLTLLVALLGAVGGILVALVIKYADGLAKNMATASSIVITTACSHVLFDSPMNAAIVLGSLVVIISGYNYQSVK